MKKIRVRFPPSPTGFLHVGGLRTALFCYLFAKKNNGELLLRIEDTDKERYVPGSVEKIIESLNWAGIEYDEGLVLRNKISNKVSNNESKNYPGVFEVGEYGPYIQSERLEIYKKYAEELVEEGKAYYCFCEPERLKKVREEQKSKKMPPMYDRHCLGNLSHEEVNRKLKEKCPFVIRLKVPKEGEVKFNDLVRGEVSFKSELLDDQVLLKSDGYPTYHLANVVDDHLMRVSHVIRGEEWLSSTPKHVLIYQAFGWKKPEFAHLPLLLNTDRSKLSKRQGDVSVEEYKKKGYLPEALLNFTALLGWNPGKGETQEIFTKKELIEKFDISHVHKAGAVFDIKRLNWINSEHIKKMNFDDFEKRAMPFLEKKDFFAKAENKYKNKEYLGKFLALEQERIEILSEIGESGRFLFEEPEYKKELLFWKEMSESDLKESLQKSKEVLQSIKEKNWERENLEKELLEVAGEKRGDLLWPLRVALTGEEKSPSPFEIAWVLGKEESLERIKKATSLLG